MSFNEFDDEQNNEPLSEINMIPMIDVMLVLLILFIITAPLFTPHATTIDIPQASSQESPDKPNNIALAIDDKGTLFWNDERIDDKELLIRLKKAAQKEPQPELHIRADKNTLYQRLAEIMSSAQNAGITRLGFVSQPK
ncbi:MAG: biopolymer transporter ExbD [Thiomargarita sp.]|nr:biopolymer transporter ExbD [Thiomargarita sp.]